MIPAHALSPGYSKQTAANIVCKLKKDIIWDKRIIVSGLDNSQKLW